MGGLKIKVHFLIKVDFLKYRFKKSSAKNIKGLIKKKCDRRKNIDLDFKKSHSEIKKCARDLEKVAFNLGFD